MRLALFLLTFSAFALNASTVNVALSGTVTGIGNFSGAALDTVIDNTFLEEGAQSGGVTWNDRLNVIQLDLTNAFSIIGVVLQAGGNDAYRLDYKNTATNNWETLWDISACSNCSGANTRSTQWVMASVVAQSFRFFVNPVGAGSGEYSLSEVQLFTNSGSTPSGFSTFVIETPEPGTMGLFGIALVALAIGARRFRS